MGIRSEDVLAEAALSARERGVVEHSVDRLQDELGADLLAVWLYGSRARGEADPAETDPDLRSDIDLLAIVDPSRDAAKVGWDAHEWVEEEADAAVSARSSYRRSTATRSSSTAIASMSRAQAGRATRESALGRVH